MEQLKIKDSIESREYWIEFTGLPIALHKQVKNADILIVPSRMANNPQAFMVGTSDFFAYLQAQLGDKVEICTSDENYLEIELNSRVLRLGHFDVKGAMLAIFLGLLTNYVYDRTMAPQTEPVPVEVNVNVPEYQAPATVNFTISVSDSTGKHKEFHYDGPASELKTVNDEIITLWNEE